jgi:photosystem II stability/assembly factor-like uncharacterized protein
METLVARCPANMPEATLSAWYDHELGADLDARVQDHVAHCQACQVYLDDYEATRRTLRQDRPPEMQAAIWGDVHGRIDPTKPGKARVPSRRPVITGGLAAAGAIALLFAIILAFTTHGTTSAPTSSTSTLSATATGTQHATPTHTTNTATPGATLAVTQNWQTAKGVPNGENVAFSSTSPHTGYACAFTQGSPYPSMRLYATQDGGATWQATAGQVTAGQCQLTINPANPQDVTMLASRCGVNVNCNGELPLAYRTLDGGQTWSQLSMPAGAEDGYVNVGDPLYAGNALYAFASTSASYTQYQPSLKHQLAVSISGQPFIWIDLTNLVSKNYGPVFASGNAFDIVAGDPSHPLIRSTTDGGQTWTTFTAQGVTPTELVGPIIGTPSNGRLYLLSDKVYPMCNLGSGRSEQSIEVKGRAIESKIEEDAHRVC